MTNEEAREHLKDILADVPNDKCVDWIEALKKAIKALEQQPCEDCISREETLNKINELIAEYIPLMPTGWTLPLNIAKTIIELPSVNSQEPKTGHWIAYEVQLPDRVVLNYHCSVCGRKLVGYSTETLKDASYCHCGAKMEVSE